jgi:peptidoglycan/LPS O-acetylase OafA/YrhL
LKKGSNIYYPSLDSLRAIAVIFVIISHWFASDHFLNRYTSNGTLGVTLFFVLSGFLISGILMNYKTEIDLEVITIKQTLKIFYIRRAIRIFPIYYVLIGVLLLFQFSRLFLVARCFSWITFAFLELSCGRTVLPYLANDDFIDLLEKITHVIDNWNFFSFSFPIYGGRRPK